MNVTSPKTEHHVGKGSRVLPIFPELRPLLEDAREVVPVDSEFIIQRYRNSTQNLRTQFQRIITKAGVKPWAKLWQNLRASRITELVDQFPEHVVIKWMGNTSKIAREHYLQITDEHKSRAIEEPTVSYFQRAPKCAPVLGCTGVNRDEQSFRSKSVTVDSASRNTHLHEQVGAKGWARQDSNL